MATLKSANVGAKPVAALRPATHHRGECCHGVATRPTFGIAKARCQPIYPSICRDFLCARVDSNHHPAYTGQGPQPYSPAPYTSVRVQIVRYIRVCGHIGRIGRNDLCQRCVTETRPLRLSRRPSSESQGSGLRAIASADNLNSAHASSAERPLCSANRFRNSHGSSCGRFTALSLHTCARSGVVRWHIPER
jgi:hypothetical protein